MDMEWFFDGIGTEIVSLILGAGLGGVIGFRIGVNKRITKQSQRAGSGAEQVQISKNRVYCEDEKSAIYMSKEKIQQKQTAGDNSVQKQKG